MSLTHWTQFQTSGRYPLNLQIFLHGSCTLFLSNSSVITLAHEFDALLWFFSLLISQEWKSSYTWCLVVFACKTDRWDTCPYASFQKASKTGKLLQCFCPPLEVLKQVFTEGAIQENSNCPKNYHYLQCDLYHTWKSVCGVNGNFLSIILQADLITDGKSLCLYQQHVKNTSLRHRIVQS